NGRLARSSRRSQQESPMNDFTSDDQRDRGVSRRRVLECMTWAGTGVLWTIAGGVPRSVGIMGDAMAAEPAGLDFLQNTDSHVGFDKPANPNEIGTIETAIDKIQTLPVSQSLLITTGDLPCISNQAE